MMPQSKRSDTQASDFRAFLQSELTRRLKANPRYSLRAFAKALQVDHSTLAKILAGKRPLGRIAMRRLGTKLGLSEAEVSLFATASSGAEDTDFQQLSLDSFSVISDWHHFAILELLRTDDFRADEKWIAQALGIPKPEATAAVQRLKRLGLIQQEPSTGKWFQPADGKATTLGNPFTARAFRNLQKQILEKAVVALEETPIEERDQTSMTIAVDVSKMPEAKERITGFRRELSKFLSRGDRRDEVYHLSISLYPVTRIKKGANHESV
jgi:DNA-binding Lrp family transcriptional regulator